MKKAFRIDVQIICVLVCLSMVISIACSPKGEKPATGIGPGSQAPVEAEPAPKPAEVEAEREEGGGPVDYSLEGVLGSWPEDVPLMEPYEVKGFLPDTGGYKQVSILVDGAFDTVYSYYAKALFDEYGWDADESSKNGLPGVFLSFTCRKGVRELNVMMKSEDDGAKTLVQLGITDLTKHKKVNK